MVEYNVSINEIIFSIGSKSGVVPYFDITLQAVFYQWQWLSNGIGAAFHPRVKVTR